jgi:RNA methyltransferase, TrmH family
MPINELITSTANPQIKLARSLRQRKERDQTCQFLVEGILHVGEVVEAGWEVETIFFAPELLVSDFALNLVDRQSQRGVRCQPVSIPVFEALTEKENPQGIVAVVKQKTTFLNMLNPQNFRFGTALVSPQDPGNLGTVLRTLDAVGADGLLLLDGGVDLFHPSVIRASMGTLFWKPVVRASFTEFVAWSKQYGYRLIGTSTRGSVDYHEVKFDGSIPSVLVLGSEQKGLTPEQVGACDLLVKLPMRGRASSLNLAVAAGVLLYEIMK